MPRSLRVYVLGCIAIAFGYLLLHAREPLRLNIGDPEADASVLSTIRYADQAGPLEGPAADPPLPQILYGAIGSLGVTDIGALRLFALAFSALAMLLLFQYARRIWSEEVALLATALFATSLLWMMYADSIHQAPLVHASGFLALWGLVRAIEAGQRRYLAAVFLGALACYLASYDDWLFLPAAMLFTIHSKLGNPFARGHRRFVMICAAACLAGALTEVLFASGVLGRQALALPEQQLASPLALLLRRSAFAFTPMFWVTFGYTAWRALRAPSARSVLEDRVTWMLAAGGLSLYVLPRPAASQLLGVQPLLPFYALGSASLIQRLLEGRRIQRALAIAWVGLAPVWSFYFLLVHPRSVLDRGDVAEANAYLAAHDRNDFVLSNLMAEGPIQAAFDRHGWELEGVDPPGKPGASRTGDQTERHRVKDAQLEMLEVLETTGTDYVHAVIFTTPDSRFLDRSLGRLTAGRQLWSVTGWPHLHRSKAKRIIDEYDRSVRKSLEAVGAKQVLHASNFDLYRIDRAALVEAAGRPLPVAREIDLGGFGTNEHTLLGWGDPVRTKDEGIGVSRVVGHARCPHPVMEHRAGEPARNACATAPTRAGLEVTDEGWVDQAQLMVRVERACDLRLTFELAAPALFGISINDFTTSRGAPAKQVSFVVPHRSIRAGINIVTLEKQFVSTDATVDISSLAIEPDCARTE